MRIDTDDITRVRAAKTPGWRHGTRRQPNPEKRAKAAKVRGERRATRKAWHKALAAAFARHQRTFRTD